MTKANRQETKEQHYIQEEYLKQFVRLQEPDKGALWLFDKSNPTKELRRTYPPVIAKENGFYNYTDENGKPYYGEPQLCDLEYRYYPAFKAIADDPSRTTNAIDKAKAAHYIACALVRTPAFRQTIAQSARASSTVTDNLGVLPTSDDHIREAQKEVLDRVSEIAIPFQRMNWEPIQLPQDAPPLWISDYPVPQFSPIGRTGLYEPINYWLTALSPHVALVMSHPYLPSITTTVTPTAETFISLFNGCHVWWSYRYIISQDNNFTQARTVIEQLPILGQRDRVRPDLAHYLAEAGDLEEA